MLTLQPFVAILVLSKRSRYAAAVADIASGAIPDDAPIPPPAAAPGPPGSQVRSLLFGRDTHPRAARFLIAGYRAMSPEQKLGRVNDLARTSKQLAEARIRAQYPGATGREVLLRLAALTLGRELVVKAFNWDPEREGW